MSYLNVSIYHDVCDQTGDHRIRVVRSGAETCGDWAHRVNPAYYTDDTGLDLVAFPDLPKYKVRPGVYRLTSLFSLPNRVVRDNG